MPKFSEDDVIDYQVLEALMIRESKEEEKAEKKKQKDKWKRDKENLKKKV